MWSEQKLFVHLAVAVAELHALDLLFLPRYVRALSSVFCFFHEVKHAKQTGGKGFLSIVHLSVSRTSIAYVLLLADSPTSQYLFKVNSSLFNPPCLNRRSLLSISCFWIVSFFPCLHKSSQRLGYERWSVETPVCLLFFWCDRYLLQWDQMGKWPFCLPSQRMSIPVSVTWLFCNILHCCLYLLELSVLVQLVWTSLTNLTSFSYAHVHQDSGLVVDCSSH